MMGTLRFIPTKIHGFIDYAMGAFLSTSPLYLKGFKNEKKSQKKDPGVEDELKKLEPQQLIPYGMGVLSTAYSLFTNYELGAVRKIPMKVHLALDAVNGALMAASPWLFGFYKKVWIPFVAIGAFEMGAALFTKFEEDEFAAQPAL